jgi:hypothetical protein
MFVTVFIPGYKTFQGITTNFPVYLFSRKEKGKKKFP